MITDLFNRCAVVLMTRPDHFEPAKPHPDHGYQNAFEESGRKRFMADPMAFRRGAMNEWLALKGIVANFADVIVAQMPEGMADFVYTADGSISLVNAYTGEEVSVLSQFTNANRGQEVAFHKAILEEHFPSRVLHQSPFALEGTGDNVYDQYRNLFWSGCVDNPNPGKADHGRSDIRAHAFLAEKTGVEVVSMHTQKPLYHMDTVLAPLPGGHMLAYLEGMPEATRGKFLDNAFKRFGLKAEQYLIQVSKEDAMAFACNVRCFGKNIIIPLCSEKLQDDIRGKGYNVWPMNMDHLIGGGGSGHCATNNLTEIMVPGGGLHKNRNLLELALQV